MSDNNDTEKTEDPTQKRRDDSREEGRIPRSQELTIAGSLLGSAMVLSAMGPVVANTLFQMMGHGLGNLNLAVNLDRESATALLRDTASHAFLGTIGLILALTIGAGVMAALQARGVMSMKPLMPDFSRMSPGKNFKNMIGMKPIVELVKSLGKLAIVGVVVWHAVKAALPDVIALSQESQLSFLMIVKTYGIKLLATAGTAYLALAAVDYLYQWYQFEQSLKMSKDEVKQEAKQNDGDPHIKQRRRSIARSYARKQMMRDVPRADVVIVNPTHIAIAIKYDPSIAPAPIVLAIGMNKVAERIKAIAAESGVPMVENKPLARALLKTARVGTLIPFELYMAVAEILAFVLRNRRQKALT